jgi:hypothetical protein
MVKTIITIIQTDAVFLAPLRWRAHPELGRPEVYAPQGIRGFVPSVSETALDIRTVPHFSAL